MPDILEHLMRQFALAGIHIVIIGGDEERNNCCSANPNYTSPAGHHRHKCMRCSTVWEHSNWMAGDQKAHECPKCGTEEWHHYRGTCAPTRLYSKSV